MLLADKVIGLSDSALEEQNRYGCEIQKREAT
jgi:hypothetical protein